LKPEINVRDETGISSYSKDCSGNCPLHYACINGNYDVALVLLKNEADCDAVNQIGQTPLIICSQKGHDALLSLLLTIGADINYQDNELNTALHYACLFCFQLQN
jgi:ankyrin repeat protein